MPVFSRILCPVDGSPTSDRGAREATRLAAALQAELRFVSVADLHPLLLDLGSSYSPEVFDQVEAGAARTAAEAADAARAAGVPAQASSGRAMDARVCDVIVDEARRWNADLIVLGTHGRRGVRRLMLGSDAEAVLRQAPCDVLLIRSTKEDEPAGA
jgi:nucleotide-binding universal stress UspA family protein